MRIIKGKLKSRRFDAPKSFPSRPTTDFAKEGLFNILNNRIDLDGIEVLDLCAGTGNISLEFASQGAKSVLSVDQNYNCVKFIRDTAKKFEVDDIVSVVKSDVVKYAGQCLLKFDLIFSDPPFADKFHEDLVNTILSRQLLKPDGWLIIEHGRQTNLESHPNFVEMRKFGNVHFSFFKSSL